MWGAQGVDFPSQQFVEGLNFNPRPWTLFFFLNRISWTRSCLLTTCNPGYVCVLESLVDFKWKPAFNFSMRSLAEQPFNGSVALLREAWWHAHLPSSWLLLPPSSFLLARVYRHSCYRNRLIALVWDLTREELCWVNVTKHLEFLSHQWTDIIVCTHT